MARIDDLRKAHAGRKPSEVPKEILQEMLDAPYDQDATEIRVRHAITRGKSRGMLNSAIRAKCLDCVGWSQAEVLACADVRCPLWPFRMGKNPFRDKRVMSDEHLAAMQKGRKAK